MLKQNKLSIRRTDNEDTNCCVDVYIYEQREIYCISTSVQAFIVGHKNYLAAAAPKRDRGLNLPILAWDLLWPQFESNLGKV